MGYIYSGGARRVMIWSREDLENFSNQSCFDFLGLNWHWFLGLVRSICILFTPQVVLFVYFKDGIMISLFIIK